MNDEARISTTEVSGIRLFQFVGLLWAVEYNAYQARLGSGINPETVNGMNTLLVSYAALEALITETAACVLLDLYAMKEFRKAGLKKKFSEFLHAVGRGEEKIPDEIQEIADSRIALTHSEPDNERSRMLGRVVSATDALRFARSIRRTAEWLWQGKRPGAVAQAFDQPNGFMTAEEFARFSVL